MKLVLYITSVIVLLIILSGCGGIESPDKIYKRDYAYKQGEVVYINPPKHFSVHIKFANGTVHKLRSNKHCNGWREHVKVGDVYNIPIEIQYYESGKVSSIYHVKSCDLIRGDYKVND